MKYPTDWQGGIHRGSIRQKGNTYLATMSPPGVKQINKFFSFKTDKEKELQHNAATNFLKEMSDKLSLTLNKYRYLDKNTIEVKLTKDKTFVTDAKFVDKVNLYKMYVKNKKEKGIIRCYAMCQKKKKSFVFTDLICNCKIVQFLDGNSLNLRESNIKEFGKIIPKEAISDEIKYDMDHYEYFNKKINDLPKGIWILGKPSGTIFKRGGQDKIYTVSVLDKSNKTHVKTFDISKYDSDDHAKMEATRWQYNTSYQLGMTKNLIKIINNEYIEVSLTKNQIMITDIIYIPLIQNIFVHVTNSHGTKIYYASCSLPNNIDIQYYNLISSSPMTDHINHNTLDNRLINLRYCDYSINNRNRTSTREHIGINFVNNINPGYVAYGKHNKVIYSHLFTAAKCGSLKQAKQMAIIFRKNIIEIDVNTPHLEFTGEEKIKDLEFLIKNIDNLQNDMMKYTASNIYKYFNNITLSESDKSQIFDKYWLIRMQRIFNLDTKLSYANIALNKLKKFENIKGKHMFNSMPYFNTIDNFVYKPKIKTQEKKLS